MKTAVEIQNAIADDANKLIKEHRLHNAEAINQAMLPHLEELTLKLEHARQAIRRVLGRIHEDDSVRYHLGCCTQTYNDLCYAFSEITGAPVAEVMEQIIPESSKIRHGASWE